MVFLQTKERVCVCNNCVTESCSWECSRSHAKPTAIPVKANIFPTSLCWIRHCTEYADQAFDAVKHKEDAAKSGQKQRTISTRKRTKWTMLYARRILPDEIAQRSLMLFYCTFFGRICTLPESHACNSVGPCSWQWKIHISEWIRVSAKIHVIFLKTHSPTILGCVIFCVDSRKTDCIKYGLGCNESSCPPPSNKKCTQSFPGAFHLQVSRHFTTRQSARGLKENVPAIVHWECDFWQGIPPFFRVEGRKNSNQSGSGGQGFRTNSLIFSPVHFLCGLVRLWMANCRGRKPLNIVVTIGPKTFKWDVWTVGRDFIPNWSLPDIDEHDSPSLLSSLPHLLAEHYLRQRREKSTELTAAPNPFALQSCPCTWYAVISANVAHILGEMWRPCGMGQLNF